MKEVRLFVLALGLSLLTPAFSFSQTNELPFIEGLRVYSSAGELLPPIILRGDTLVDGGPNILNDFITIEFDVHTKLPPDLQIKFFHCNRDWVIDQNIFLIDEYHNTTSYLNYKSAPDGVKYYTYHYTNQFPDPYEIIRFNYSGNWVFQIFNSDNPGTVLAEGRFIVVDMQCSVHVNVINDYFTEVPSPLNQVNRVLASVIVPEELNQAFVTTADVYQNWRLYNPRRIDVNDRDPYTFVEGITSSRKRFIVNNVEPGNEYRKLDLSSLTAYPNGQPVQLLGGPDQSRFYWEGGKDLGGGSRVTEFTGIRSDYLNVEFRLQLAQKPSTSIFLVGAFNQWHPNLSDLCAYDSTRQLYTVWKWVKRGIYDYQYILGSWDSARGEVVKQNWVALEGNDWRTIDEYTVVVYYNDPRFGGFDRIVGIGVASSNAVIP
ncbi:MAG: type IX secretion system plug protein domain-containing protein [Bacteroidota bacterium]